MITNGNIFDSKPMDNRLEKEMATYDILDKLNIEYMGLDHGEAATMEDLLEVEKILDVRVGKNLLLCNSSKTKFYLLVMPGDKKFLTKDFSKQIGSSRLSFASSEYMVELLNITPGGLSVLGLMFDAAHKVQLAIDKDLLENEYFGCHPCVNTSTIKVKTEDVVNKFIKHTGHEPYIVEL